MNTSTQLAQLREALEAWLKLNDFGPDIHFYTQEEWQRRGEEYGNTAVLTMTFEGPLNHIMNGHYAVARQDELYGILKKHGFWGEMGYSWSLHIYPAQEGK